MIRKRRSRVSALLVLSWLALLGGCMKPYYGPASPYAQHYGENLGPLEPPEAGQIRSAGRLWTFSRAPEDVWESCLKVATQYEGVLQVDTVDPAARRLLFIHGQEAIVKAPKGKRTTTLPFPKFMDVWIAVALFPEADGRRTTVAAAVISPETGQPTQSFQVSEAGKAQGRQKKRSKDRAEAGEMVASVPSVTRMAEVTVAFAEQNRLVAPKFQEARDASAKWSLVPQATINEFFYHLGIHLYGPPEWREKFFQAEAKRRPPKRLEDLEHHTILEEHEVLETQAGNWTSAKLRRSLQIVNCPEVVAAFEEIAAHLAEAAQKQETPVHVYIVASPEINAFALPNGDVFLCTGLLGVLSDPHELAAVIAHELDHVYQHDTIERLKSARDAENLRTLIIVAGGAGGAAAGLAAGLSVAGETATMAATAPSLTSQMVTNVVTSGVQSFAGVVGYSLGTAMVLGYSRATELRADRQGAQYLWAAGYDVEAELRLFAKLRDCKALAEKRKEQIVSGLINCKPGLEERTAEMNKTLATLRKSP